MAEPRLVLDAGDLLDGTLQSGHSEPGRSPAMARAVFDACAAMGLDVFTPGEGDLSAGLDRLEEALRGARFSVLAANLVRARDGRRPFGGVALRQIGGWQVGIVGVMGRLRGVSDEALRRQGVELLPPAPVLRKSIEVLRRAGAQLIVVNAHMDRKEAAELVQEAGGGVNVIVAGHERSTRREAQEVQGALVVGGGFRGRELGRLQLFVRDGSLAFHPTADSRPSAQRRRSLQSSIDYYRKMLAKQDQSPAEGTVEELKQRDSLAERLAAKEKELAELEQRLAEPSQQAAGSSYSFDLIRLDSSIPEDPAVKEMLRQARQDQTPEPTTAPAATPGPASPPATGAPPSTATPAPHTEPSAPAAAPKSSCGH